MLDQSRYKQTHFKNRNLQRTDIKETVLFKKKVLLLLLDVLESKSIVSTKEAWMQGFGMNFRVSQARSWLPRVKIDIAILFCFIEMALRDMMSHKIIAAVLRSGFYLDS